MGVRITPRDVERFTKGDCDVLAEELHKLTGWPICTLRWESKHPALHAFVLAPGRVAVDIKGARHVSTIVREWADEGAKGYLRGCWPIGGGVAYTGSRQRAKKIAPHLAAMVTSIEHK